MKINPVSHPDRAEEKVLKLSVAVKRIYVNKNKCDT